MKHLYFLFSVVFVVSNSIRAQNVGIGTSSPSARLHIQTPNLAINEASFRVQPLGGGSSNTSQFSLIDMWSTFDNFSADQLPRRTASVKAGYSGGTWGNEYLSFRVGGSNDAAIEPSERMRILANGTVIINSLSSGYVKSTSGTLSSSTTVPWADISGAPAFLTSYTETDPQVGANSTSYVPRWDGGALVSGVIQDNGTNVGISKVADATYNLDVNGSLRVSANNSNGGGLQLADDGDIVDNNDGFATHRFSYGLRITNANKGGSTVVQIANGASGSGNTYFNAGNNFGINTTGPIQTLDVNGRINVSNGVIQRGGAAITTTSDLGLYSRVSGNWMRYVTNGAPHRFFADDGAGSDFKFSIETNGSLLSDYNEDGDYLLLPESYCVIVPRNRGCPTGWQTFEVKWDTADVSNADAGKNGIIAWDDGSSSSVRMRFCCRGGGW